MNADTVIFVVYSLTLGIVAAFIWSLITKAIYGRLVDALIKSGAESEATAKTFEELGIKKSRILTFSLDEKRALGRLIKKSGESYYLPPETKLKAQSLYSSEKITPITVIVTFLLFAAIILLCNYVIPLIMN